jgi:phosphoribosylformylglycinamidine synthase I
VAGKAAVLIFPGTNSEDETLRMLHALGIDAELVHWSRGETLPSYDAYVLPGGFAYEDRIRAGAIPAHDRMMDHVIEGAQMGKLVLGICNGAQILLEAGLVPGTGEIRRPTAAFTRNVQRHFVSKHVQVRLAVDPARSPFTAVLEKNALIPAWASHGEGRLAASDEHLREIVEGAHVAFTYEGGAPNGAALDCAALVNQPGNVLAIMPHPERDGWNFNHPATAGDANPLEPNGGSVFFEGFARALR